MQTLTHRGWFLLCFYQDRVGVTISKLGYNPGNNHTNRNVGGIVLSVVLSLASKHHWEHIKWMSKWYAPFSQRYLTGIARCENGRFWTLHTHTHTHTRRRLNTELLCILCTGIYKN